MTKHPLKSNQTLVALLFLLPSLVLLFTFIFFPMAKTTVVSFFSNNLAGQVTKFVGLDNYRAIFSDSLFIKVLLQTITYVVAATVLMIGLALVLAELTANKLRGMSVYRTIITATMGVSAAAASVLWLFMVNPSVGIVAKVITFFGGKNTNVLTTGTGAMVTVILSSVWLGLGFAYLNILGALQSVPTSLYEVAEIAGWSHFARTRKITLPMISPTLFFLVVVEVIEHFKTFTQIDLITAGGPDNATNLIAYKVYVDAFQNGDIGAASAEAIILTIIITIVTWIQFRFTERKVYYG